ncbi:MAG: DUF790 family protein [Planctomycetes bacterium]|nr:DUF790 family protein [Planctomycetota bacterium]
MLTRDLLRFKLRDGAVVPTLLRATPATVDLAERLVAFWRAGIGQRRGDLEDALAPVMHQSRALVVARGINKVLLDASRFAEAASSAELRGRAFAASARILALPLASGEAHAAAVAAELAVTTEDLRARLYGDLPDAEVLEDAPQLSAAQVIARYNLALCQGLLVSAKSLSVVVLDADTGMRRRLLKSLRFRRLLARVDLDRSGELRLDISGPASVLDQASRYGVQLALFLPALACAQRWTAHADITVTPRGGGRTPGRMSLSHELGLVGDSAFLGHVPEELRELEHTLAARYPAWRFAEPALIGLPGGEVLVPDLQIAVDAVPVAVELFHRWHAAALARRIRQLEDGLPVRLAIGVERALARSTAIAPLIATPAFARHGFLFTDIPAPRAVAEAVERCACRS